LVEILGYVSTFEGGHLTANKIALVVGIISLFILSALAPLSLGITVNVSTIEQPTNNVNGNTLYVGGSGPNNYTTIQSAIDDASGGDTVYVYDDSAPYYENIVVNKYINLIGENRETTVIDFDCSYGYDNFYGIWVYNCNGFYINGFTLTSPDFVPSVWRKSGLYINKSNNILIDNNIFQNINIEYPNAAHGIYLNSVSNVTISNNKVYDINARDDYRYPEPSGICIEQGTKIRILNNTISCNNEDICGIDISDSEDINILDNRFSNNYVGLKISHTNTCIITNNYFSYNGGGLDLWFSKGSIVKYNNFTNNYVCTYFWELENCLITYNNFIDNSIGSKNQGVRNSIMTHNNFIRNNHHIEDTILSSPDFNYEENYWDDWIGIKFPSLDSLPYIGFYIDFILFIFIFTFNFWIDRNPAKEPYDIEV
jgi:parallel beta-helix repeat protein